MLTLNHKSTQPVNFLYYAFTKLALLLLALTAPFALLGDWSSFFVGALIYIGIPLSIYKWLQYKNYTFIIEEDKLTIFSGIISKNTRTVPFTSIQNVETSSGLLARMFGLAEVGIWTASPSQIQIVNGNSSNKDDIVFYINTSDVELLKIAIYKK